MNAPAINTGPVSLVSLARLSDPTPEEEIKHRPAPGRSGKQLDYIDARYVMDTLDRICGKHNWHDEYESDLRSTDGIVCTLSIRVDDGSEGGAWVAKSDVGIESKVESTKGSYSDAFKRAAVKWGIGRDLYDEDRAEKVTAGVQQSKKDNKAKSARLKREAKAEGSGEATAKPQPIDINPANAPWLCPDHDGVQVWPAGVSAAGRKYEAFYACPEGRDCVQRAPRGLKVQPEHLQERLDGNLDF